MSGSEGRIEAQRLVVARVRGLHGLRGAVKVESLTDRPHERFEAGRQLFVEGSESALTIAEAQPDGPGWRLRFLEVADRTAAEILRETYLEAIVGGDERLAEGEFYWHEVIGTAVLDPSGASLGRVVDIYRAGGAEVAIVSGEGGEIDVPLVKSIVRSLDPAKGEMVVDTEALGLGEVSVDDGPGSAADL